MVEAKPLQNLTEDGGVVLAQYINDYVSLMSKPQQTGFL
jgi:hypothetical protein